MSDELEAAAHQYWVETFNKFDPSGVSAFIDGAHWQAAHDAEVMTCGHARANLRHGVIRDVVRLETDAGDEDGGSTSGEYCSVCRELEALNRKWRERITELLNSNGAVDCADLEALAREGVGK